MNLTIDDLKARLAVQRYLTRRYKEKLAKIVHCSECTFSFPMSGSYYCTLSEHLHGGKFYCASGRREQK